MTTRQGGTPLAAPALVIGALAIGVVGIGAGAWSLWQRQAPDERIVQTSSVTAPTSQGSGDARAMPVTIRTTMKAGADGNENPIGLGDIFQRGREAIRDTTRILDDTFVDFMGLTTEEQIDVGKEVAAALTSETPILNDRRAIDRVVAQLRPVLEVQTLPDIPITLILLDTDQVNAFAHVGGYVYVCRGLLEIVDDRELQFVLAHEVGHLVHRHGLAQLTLYRRSGIAGNPVALVHHALAVGYSQQQEDEADTHGAYVMWRLGHGVEPGIKFFERLREMYGDPFATDPPDDPAARLEWEVANHFRTHPPYRHRIELLRKWTPPADGAAPASARRGGLLSR